MAGGRAIKQGRWQGMQSKYQSISVTYNMPPSLLPSCCPIQSCYLYVKVIDNYVYSDVYSYEDSDACRSYIKTCWAK